eukprot:6444151-Alexandrium_andersonii.AAC.1
MDRSAVGVVKAIAKDKVTVAWPGAAGQKDHAVGVLELWTEDPAKEREEREAEMERKRRKVAALPLGVAWAASSPEQTRLSLCRWVENMVAHLHTVCGSEHSDLRLSFLEQAPRLHAARDLKVRGGAEKRHRPVTDVQTKPSGANTNQ